MPLTPFFLPLGQMITFDGPRAGQCSERPVPLGWLQQALERGQMPREVKVWAVEGGTAWVGLGQELDRKLKAEKAAARKAPPAVQLQAAARGRQARKEAKGRQEAKAAVDLLEAIKEKLGLPGDMSQQRAVAEALQRCGLKPSATVQGSVQAVAGHLGIASAASCS